MRFKEQIRGLWHIREGQKIADRPHPITIVLALLTPFVAVAAVTSTFLGFRLSTESLRVSQEALETSQQSLRIGQQAYVVIELTFGHFIDKGDEGCSWAPFRA